MNMKISKNGNQPIKSNKRPMKKSIHAAKNRDEAIEYIKCAIDSLGQEALDGDPVVKEAIANLGVVMFDLK